MTRLPEPFYFGAVDAPLGGWIHRPQDAPSADVGLVLCQAMFHESLACHRTLRHLADAAARHGIPSLRFDYFGTRDSAGLATDPEQLNRWIESVNRAADELKAVAKVSRVCFLGIRFGATLAALAAAGRSDVAALVAIAPVVKGRAYLRELRAFALNGSTTPTVADHDDIGGFAITADTRAAIGAVDLLALSACIAPRVLLVQRDDLPADSAWSTHLVRSGSHVDEQSAHGYAGMMLEPHFSVLPAQMIAEVSDWLAKQCASSPAREANGSAATPLTNTIDLRWRSREGEINGIRETSAFLDPAGTVFGVVAEPTNETRALIGRQPAVILLINAGAVPHFGPGRLYVLLARTWAAGGEIVLRIDLSGLGDSPVRQGEDENVVYSRRANEDIARAVAYVQQRYPGARIYVTGICSGGYHGFKAAVAGLRIDGVVVINPLTFFWKDGMSLESTTAAQAVVGTLRSAGLSGSVGYRALRRAFRLASAIGERSRHCMAVGMDVVRRIGHVFHLRLPGDLAAELRSIAERNVKLLFVFSDDARGRLLLQQQGGSMVTALTQQGSLSVQVISGADHTFTHQRDKDQLISLLTGVVTTRKPLTTGEDPERS